MSTFYRLQIMSESGDTQNYHEAKSFRDYPQRSDIDALLEIAAEYEAAGVFGGDARYWVQMSQVEEEDRGRFFPADKGAGNESD